MRDPILQLTLLCATASFALAQPHTSPGQIPSAEPPHRLALVFGNSNYHSQNKLCNPGNDAREVAGLFREAGFEVQIEADANLKTMQSATREFIHKIRPGDFVVYYFSGHGAQVNGTNYLIPVDFEAKDEIELADNAYPVERVSAMLDTAGAKVKLIILDACSNNPFLGQKGAAGGLGKMDGGEGTLIAFAASPGKTASDNCGAGHSLYTEHLLTALRDRSASVLQVMQNAQKEVYKASNAAQAPWISSGYLDYGLRFWGNGVEVAGEGVARTADAGCPLHDEVALWHEIHESHDPEMIRGYLARCPNGVFADGARRLLKPLDSGSTRDDVIMTLIGSNTIGSEAAPALVMEWLRSLGAVAVKSVHLGLDKFDIQGDLNGRRVIVHIEAPGSEKGFACLQAGQCDIAMASRQATVKDAVGQLQNEILASNKNEHVIGLDGIVVLVNRSNDIPGLTIEQLRGIYTGEITDWYQLGGREHHPIHVLARDDNSGTWKMFRDLVLGGRPLAGSVQRIEDSRQLSDLVAFDPDALGFAGLPFVLKAKAIPVMGITASALTIGQRTYPLSRELYLYTKAEPANRYVKNFLEFAMFGSGQKIVETAGFVGQNLPERETVAEQSGISVSGEYARWVMGAAPQRFSFRFGFDQKTLESKSQDDLRRLRELVAARRPGSYEILLAGFTDDIGSESYNDRLSEERARWIAAQAFPGDARVLCRGFGKRSPAVAGDPAEARRLSRRVEVWIRETTPGPDFRKLQ